MKKIHKIIAFSAAAVVISGASVVAAVPGKGFSNLRSEIGSFLSGKGLRRDKLNPAETQCLKEALGTYRTALKDGQDKFVSASKDLRAGYKANVNGAALDLKNVNAGDKGLKKEKANELKNTRDASLNEWSDKMRAARDEWMQTRQAANAAYRGARMNCLGQTANENLSNAQNGNANLPANMSPGEASANANENGNVNANANTNANGNQNSNSNANQ